MAEYIGRDDAINFELSVEVDPECVPYIVEGMQLYAEYLKQIPTVNIVRCGECVYYKRSFGCVQHNLFPTKNWFCASGRRLGGEYHGEKN